MKIITFVIKVFAIEFLQPNKDYGWGNGYVAISSKHPLYEVELYDTNIGIHGGITFCGFAKNLKNKPKHINDNMWVFGFDTVHMLDTKEKWPDEVSILTEAEKLKEYLINYINENI